MQSVTSELVVRYLDAWVPRMVRSARRATVVRAWPERADGTAAEAALRACGEFADQLAGRRLSLIFLAPALDGLDAHLTEVRRELNGADLDVFAVAGAVGSHLGPVVKAAQAAGGPILGVIEVDPAGTGAGAAVDAAIAAVRGGKPAELLLISPVGSADEVAGKLDRGRYELVSSVDLVAGDDSRLLTFATGSAKSLEAFKNELWQLDEFAGVRIRDPHDPDGQVVDIALHPQPGPLRRQILAFLEQAGPQTVTEVRRYALTETVYRADDVTAVLHALVQSDAVRSDAGHGRLAGDTTLSV